MAYDYRDDLFDCIAELPEGDLKEAMKKKYPTYYFRTLLKKYGNDPFDGLWDMFKNMGSNPNKRQFFWYEHAKMDSTESTPGESVTITVKPEDHGK